MGDERLGAEGFCLNGLVQTQVEELAGNRVRLTVEVPSGEVRHAIDHAASDLAASVKIPGFRKGKVPMPVLVRRVGRERLFAEAVDSHIGGWFRNAAARSRIRPVERPEYDYELPAGGEGDWTFTATVAVQPKPEPADWTALEVPYREPEVPEELVAQELEALRSSVAELVPVEGRAAAAGDTVVVDMVAGSGETQRDTVVELGSGRLVEELEADIQGMELGERKEIDYELADGSTRTVAVTVKEIKEKLLPELGDELARAASEFDTLAELRASIDGRLRAQLEEEAETELRAEAVDRLVEASGFSPEPALVEGRARELLEGVLASLERRGISADAYLSLTGQTPERLQERLWAEAAQAVARELVLEAVADRLGIDVSDAEVEELIREQAGEDADEVVRHMFESGQTEQLREDLRLRDALDRVVAEVKRIPVELAAAREKLWTPGKENAPGDTKLWTPSGKETT